MPLETEADAHQSDGDGGRRRSRRPLAPLQPKIDATQKPFGSVLVPVEPELRHVGSFRFEVHRICPITVSADRSLRCTVETEHPKSSAIDSSVSPSTKRSTHASLSSLFICSSVR